MASGARVKIKGLATAVRKIEAMAKAGGEANVSGMRVIAEAGMADINESKPGHGVPVDEGILRSSGRVRGPDNRGAVQITYGGASAPYALYQHENTHLLHNVGEARWLVRWLERWQSEGGVLVALKRQAQAAVDAAKKAK